MWKKKKTHNFLVQKTSLSKFSRLSRCVTFLDEVKTAISDLEKFLEGARVNARIVPAHWLRVGMNTRNLCGEPLHLRSQQMWIITNKQRLLLQKNGSPESVRVIKSGFLACQQKSSNLLRCWRRSLHWEGLSRSRLTICKHANIVALARRPWRQCQRFNIRHTGWRVLLWQWMSSTFKKIVMFTINI